MASYRLIDEMPEVRKSRPPYSPLGLFFMTMLFFPLTAPFWVLNWGRLGRPEKRLLTGIAALAAFGVPIVLSAAGVNVETVKILRTLFKFAFAYFLLDGQRPLYEAHMNRGGKASPSWPLWVGGIVITALWVAFLFVRNGR